MARPFEGTLTDDPDSLKQFFITQDALLPLEWRVNFLAGENNAYMDFSRFFDRIVSHDHSLYENSHFYHQHANAMHLNVELKDDDSPRDKLAEISSFPFLGIDIMGLPVRFIEQDPGLLDYLAGRNFNIRRMDILFPVYGYKTTADLVPWEKYSRNANIQLNIITQHDPVEVDQWYSKPNYEGRVDPVPEPYSENGVRYAPMGDALFYKDGFYLNGQLTCEETIDGNPFMEGFDPKELISHLLIMKVTKYHVARNTIQNRVGNIYWTYFNWVVDHVTVNMDYSFVPEVILPKYTRYYRQCVQEGIFQDTPLGLLIPGKPVKPIVEIIA